MAFLKINIPSKMHSSLPQDLRLPPFRERSIAWPRQARSVGVVRAARGSAAILLLFLGLIALFQTDRAFGQSVASVQTINREYLIRAAYLYNFAQYTQWPKDTWPDENAPFTIGVLGPNLFGSSLNQIAAQKQVQGRRIVVHYFKDLKEYRPCQILYVSPSVPVEQQKGIVKKLANTNVLLVGEEDTFLQHGGMIGFIFVREINKVKFIAHLEAIQRSSMKISSKVLTLATLFKPDAPPK